MADAVDEIALAQGDVAEAVGDLKEATGKVGDVVVAIDACNGPARGRIVIEAKDSRLSKPKALEELDRAIAERSADFAVLVVPTDAELPAKLEPLREYNGDKMVVALDPEAGRLPLEYAYRIARARALMKRSDADGIDADAVRATAERALAALNDERKIKNQLTGPRRASTRRTGSSTRCPRGSARCSRRSTRSCGPRTRRPAERRPTTSSTRLEL